MKLRILQIMAYMTTLLWMIVGTIIIGSIYFSTALWEVNLVIGTLFIIFSLFIYQKEKSFLVFLKESFLKEDSTLYKQVVFYETFSLLLSFLFVLISFLGIFTRVFLEHFSVFG